MLQYRSFRNDDPPALAEIWNETFTGRGAVVLRHSSPLERHVFSKPFFDPAGLILAVEDGVPIGFAHAGFGSNATESATSLASGVVCAIGVRPSHQRRGVGSELMERCEAYLQARGARTFFAGPQRPLDPFYFGLYGGCELPGFLTSDVAAAAFFEYQGYRPWETRLVFQRRLDREITVADARFPALRRRFSVVPSPRTVTGTWWRECVLGPVEPVEFRLEEATTGRCLGRAEVWEMEGFSWRWGVSAVGLFDLTIDEGVRRQGLGKYFVDGILRYLQEQFFGVIEIQAPERNQAVIRLFHGLGFEQVDCGRTYRRERGAPGGGR